MPCLKDEYAKEKAENAKNKARGKGARRNGRSVRRTGGVERALSLLLLMLPCVGGFGV